mmetsp:Transcript_35290/g.79748  ORF Transcript_35290/g.79748 Transcript_35290/m.79748 type:complete len:170 (+) Transcript_35290:1258-1767(+)
MLATAEALRKLDGEPLDLDALRMNSGRALVGNGGATEEDSSISFTFGTAKDFSSKSSSILPASFRTTDSCTLRTLRLRCICHVSSLSIDLNADTKIIAIGSTIRAETIPALMRDVLSNAPWPRKRMFSARFPKNMTKRAVIRRGLVNELWTGRKKIPPSICSVFKSCSV